MLDSIESAIENIRKGKIVVVVDDEDRENEGDFVAAAECVTPEMINFMATHGRGLICAPLLEERCDELGLELMVGQNTAAYETPFTISVDLNGHGTTTGISASDRAKTIRALVNSETRPEELGRPGHIFPLRAKAGGVLRRTGQTEASIDLARLAVLSPAGVIVEIMNEDGSMARLPELRKIADRFNLKLISIADLIAYRLEKESLIERLQSHEVETRYGKFQLTVFRQVTNGEVHMVFSKGDWNSTDEVLVRMHSSTGPSDLFDFLINPNAPHLVSALEKLQKVPAGMLVYLNMESTQETLLNRIERHAQPDKSNASTEDGASRDARDFGIGAQILREMGVHKMRVLSSHPSKRKGLVGYGLEITGYEQL